MVVSSRVALDSMTFSSLLPQNGHFKIKPLYPTSRGKGEFITLYIAVKQQFYAFLLMAETGQTSTQLPQSVHFAGSITYFDSPWLMACTGHSGSHAPQEMQSSEITWVITKHLLENLILIVVFEPYYYNMRVKARGRIVMIIFR